MMKKSGLLSAAALALMCSMAFAFTACRSDDPEQQNTAPVITAEADKTEITAGDELTLTWSATENAQVDVAYTLDGEAADDLTFTSGTPFTIDVAGDYVFTFTAEGAEDVTVTVTVNEAEIVPEHTHTFGAWQVTKVPTMSEAGSAERTCTADNCDDPATATETLTLPALNTEGTYTTQVKTAPTCEAEGATTYTYKKDDVEISFDVTVSALGHKYTAVTVAYDAAKMSGAWTAEVACDNGCDQKLTLNMEAFDASDWTLDTESGYVAPTHTADGSGNYYKTVNEDGYAVKVTVTGVTIPTNAKHTYAATYSADEYKTGEAQIGCTFDGCKKTVTVTLPVLPEKQESEGIWIWKEVTAPNNGENGNGTFTCTLKSGEESVAITVTDVVIKAPAIEVKTDKTEITEGGQVTLTWSASESAQVSVAVTKDGKAVELNVTSGTAVTIAEAGSYVFTFTAEGAKAVTVTVKVNEKVPVKYEVTYAVGDHATDGTQAPAAQTVEEGTKIDLPAALTPAEGYEFAGWSDGTKTYEAGADYTVTAAATLTAQWKFVGFTKEGDVFDIFGQAPVHPYTLEDGESLVFTADVSGMAAWEEGMFVRVDDGATDERESICFRPSNSWWDLKTNHTTALTIRSDLAALPVDLDAFNALKQDTRIVVTRSANDLSIAFDFGIIVVGYTIEGLAQPETTIYFFSFDDANVGGAVTVTEAKVVWSEAVEKPTPDPAIIATASTQEITAGKQVTLTWQSTHGATVTVTVAKNGEASTLAPVSGTPLTIDEAGTYVFTFTAESAEAVTITVTVKEPHVHSYGAWQVTKVPTMSEAGSAERTCTADNCDDPATATETLTLPALNTEGTYTTQVKTAPTCEAEGATTYTYKKDDVEISFDVTVSALGHKYTAVTVAYDAAKMSGAWTAEVACDNGCDQKLTLNMEAFDASDWTLDTESGYVAPTHTADGSGNYYKTVNEDGYAVKVTVTGVTIPTNAKHTYAATYSADEYKAGEVQIGCTYEGCDASVTVTLPALPEAQEDNVWTWRDVVAPKDGTDGSATLTCTLKSGEESVAITVTNFVIKAPVITASALAENIAPGDEVTLTWSATEGAAVSVSVTKDDEPVTPEVTSGTPFAIEEEGVYVFTFTAEGAKVVTVTVTVAKPNLVMDKAGWTTFKPDTWSFGTNGATNNNMDFLGNFLVRPYEGTDGDYSLTTTFKGSVLSGANEIDIGIVPWFRDAQNYVVIYLKWNAGNMGLINLQVLYFENGVQYGKEGVAGWNDRWLDNDYRDTLYTLNPDDEITVKVDKVYNAATQLDDYTITISGTNKSGEFVSETFTESYSISVKMAGESDGIGLYSMNDTVTFSSLTVDVIETEDTEIVPEQPDAVLPDEDEDEEVPAIEEAPVQ